MRPRNAIIRAIAAGLALVLFGPFKAVAGESLGLVGTWELVRFVNFQEQEEIFPFGEKPLGYFIYTADGRVSIHIQHQDPPEQWQSLEIRQDNTSSSSPWYVGYFGRYTLNLQAGTVTHHVEGGTILHYLGTDQQRPFTLEGDRLVIGEPGRWERELRRLPAAP